MFRSLINDAKSAAVSVLAKYAVRASVAVPFLVAAGFGTAALTLVLAERFGALTAYCIMGGAFAAIGLIAALAVTVKEQEEEVADAAAERDDTAEVATDAAAQAAVQLPLALLGTLLTPLGPGTALSGAKAIGRNLPLVVLLALVAFLFWPAEATSADETSQAEDPATPPEPGAAQWQPRNGMDRHAAA